MTCAGLPGRRGRRACHTSTRTRIAVGSGRVCPRTMTRRREKIPIGQGWGKSYPQDRYKSYPQDRCKKLPTYYIPGEPCPLVGRWAGKQTCWQTVSRRMRRC